MLLPRSFPRRIPSLIRPLRPPNIPTLPLKRRPFTNKSRLLIVSSPLSRPQLPFLSPLAGNPPLPPLSTHLRQHFARLISTERRNYYKRRITRGLKMGLTIYAILCLFHLIKLGVDHEEMEHKWPTPSEWTWKSRWCLRSAEALQHPEETGNLTTSWPLVAGYLRELIIRLENIEKEGKGIAEQGDGGFFVEGVGKTGYDVSAKSEPWRRGYFQALMGAAKAAENLEGWVTDWKQRISAPAEYMVGPSNPRPKPLPYGNKHPLLEENCTSATDSPEVFYMRILTTTGFNTKQKVDAALSYADWLGYKGLNDTAMDVYRWAMDIAVEGLPFDATRVVDKKTGLLKNNGKDLASENIIRVSTALAVYQARIGEVSAALSIFTSILKTWRSLPQALPDSTSHARVLLHKPFDAVIERVRKLFAPVKYPTALASGNEPPVRGPASLCEEAGLMTYIGEIVFALSSKENGLAWTRDAAEMAEIALLELDGKDDHFASTQRCIQCLKVGLQNWKTMIRQLVIISEKEELESIQMAKKAWFGGEKRAQAKSMDRKRWAAEEIAVGDRIKRLQPFIEGGLLDGLAPGTSLFI